MGAVESIDHNRFPKQGNWLDKRVKVTYNYDFEHWEIGTVVRDDIEAPYRMIIHIDPGRYILSSECQYEPLEG